MPATIITSSDPELIISKINQIAVSLNTKFNRNNPDIYQINRETGWGIEELRKINHFATQKPLIYRNKIIIIHQAQNMGIEAQNSLLKLLEEPPSNTYIILTTSNQKRLLPTILSRCHLIKIKSGLAYTDTHLLQPKNSIRDNLLLSDTLSSDKESVLPYLENQLNLYQSQILKTPTPAIAKTIKNIIKTIQMIRANIDPKTALDWFLLN